jgi:ATP-dependent DNA helicase RecQ
MNFNLQPFQVDAIRSLRKNAHTLLVAPTGSGKSLVFQKQLVSRAKTTKAILVSPLNALARQHAQTLRALGLTVNLGVGLRGEGPPEGPGVWVVNPERLKYHEHQGLKTWNPNLLIVDEAHCIWEWGDGFRPEFKRVLHLVKDLSIRKSFWCTATLPVAARQEIRAALPELPHELGAFSLPSQLKIERERISFSHRLAYLKNFFDLRPSQSGIIFTSTRQSAENLAQYLRCWGMSPLLYHAGMSQEERIALENSLQAHWRDQQKVIVIATTAFGMGMDYPFLQFCVLFQPSFNLLALAQAVGRVGRSGASATATVLWHEDDFLQLGWLTQGSEKRDRELQHVHDWCKTTDCHVSYLQKYFNEAVL